MANTMTLIASSTVGSGGAANITFSSIPATYTDLVIQYSLRGNNLEGVYVQFNGSTASFAGRYLYSDGTAPASGVLARYLGSINAAASAFTNGSLYIPNYAGSTNKSYSVDEVYDQNSTAGYANLVAGLWSNTAAITSVTLEAASSLTQYSTAYLYGVKNA
jgi:hypothetical protein